MDIDDRAFCVFELFCDFGGICQDDRWMFLNGPGQIAPELENAGIFPDMFAEMLIVVAEQNSFAVDFSEIGSILLGGYWLAVESECYIVGEVPVSCQDDNAIFFWSCLLL